MIEELQNTLKELQESIAKYDDYREVNNDELPYREPSNDDEIKLVRKEKQSVVLIAGAVTFAMLASVIACILKKTNIVVTIILGVVSLICLLLFIKSVSGKPRICKATAVYKSFKKTGRNGNQDVYHYYVTVVVDEPEKILSRMIQVSKNDFDKISEGSELTVIQVGKTCHARL